ncbi:MAG TPA: YceI family protein [Caldithrix abyssi]|uniref:YceI family protein n=1 Tax=Caldithrix abyssi TaxID=187145 RepID=A0A7V5RP43_CALAY|nr:YceI family protein [Caldithrix abyssi]
MMRRLTGLLTGAVILALFFTACQTKSADQKKAEFVEEGPWQVHPSATTINWTAYKTSDKVPVKGTFKADTSSCSAYATKTPGAQSALGAVDGVEFRIPVADIFSGNEERDGILKKFFFGLMAKTMDLKGSIHLDDEAKKSGHVSLTMNGETHDFPVTFAVAGDTISLNGTINLEQWNIVEAMNSLNEHCKLKHTGDDGVSKTWSVVDISAVTVVGKE